KDVARFGMSQMRHSNALITSRGGAVTDLAAAQSGLNPTDNTAGVGPSKVSRPTTSGSNGTAVATTAPMVHATSATANTDVLNILSRDVRLSSTNPTLLPAGNDDVSTQDTPVYNMLADTKTELTGATGILSGDLACRNTVVVLVVGGGEGDGV